MLNINIMLHIIIMHFVIIIFIFINHAHIRYLAAVLETLVNIIELVPRENSNLLYALR